MNRRERRRAAKLGSIVETKLGRVVFDIKPGDDTSGDICFVCDKPATAWPFPQRGGTAHGFAEINDDGRTQVVLLCEACFNTKKISDTIMRKYSNAPDLKITEGGGYESVDKLRADIADAIKERREASDDDIN